MKFYHNIAPIDRAQNMWDTYVLQTDCSSGAFLLITFFFVMKFYHNIAPIDRAQNMWNTYVFHKQIAPLELFVGNNVYVMREINYAS